MSATSIYDLYEFYLEPRDLKEKAHLVQVQSVKVNEVFNQRAKKLERKIVLRFVNRKKAMILNKTQAGDLADITGTDDYNKWIGAECVLVADRAQNGKDTIRVCTRDESGDVDLAFAGTYEVQFKELCKRLAYDDKQSAQVLSNCEGSYRSAVEYLKEQNKEMLK